jgi:predicted dehydrogenase
MSPGPESWHPDPAFLFQRGAGPLFDIGPYHLSSLIALLGPIRQVSGAARITYPERTIGSGPKKGQKFQVDAPTFTTALLEFAGGSIVTLALSFDVQAASVPPLELYGTEGTVSLAIPFFFGGKVRLRRSETEEWQNIELTHSYAETDGRGIGVADMAHALRSGRPHRANGEIAYHVLDVMHAIEEAASTGSRVKITSTCERPAPMPSSLPDYTLDD